MRYLIGIGDYLGFDDSIGLRVAERAAEDVTERARTRGADLPRVIELGGNVIDLAHYLDPATERVLIVDAAVMGVEPGAFAFFGVEDVESCKVERTLGGHQADVLGVLELAREINGALPPLTFLGIQPHAVKPEAGLSSVLEARFDEYVAAALAFFERA